MTNSVSAPRTGSSLGGFVLEECLGEIAGSWFFTGRSGAGANVLVEVGLPPTPPADGDGPNDARLRREGVLVGKLDHASIAAVLGCGTTAEGRAYVVRTPWRGKDLAAIVQDDGPLPPPRAFAVLEQLLQALAFAHARGIVHGNVRPSLVALTHGPATQGAERVEQVVLAGFGHLDTGLSESDAAALLERESEPHLLSPERLHGEPPGPGSDVFQAALVGFLALTGESLVPADKLLRVRAWHKRGRPVLPRWLEQSALGPIFARALRTEARERFADASAFLEALDGIDPAAVVVCAEKLEPLAALPRARTMRPLAIQGMMSGLPGKVVGQLGHEAERRGEPGAPAPKVVPVLPHVLAKPGVDPSQIRSTVADLSQPQEGTFDDHPAPSQVVYGFDTFDLSVEAKQAERAKREAKQRAMSSRKTSEDGEQAGADLAPDRAAPEAREVDTTPAADTVDALHHGDGAGARTPHDDETAASQVATDQEASPTPTRPSRVALTVVALAVVALVIALLVLL